MLRRHLAALAFGAAIAISTPAHALQCVPFARDNSGISLRGDAWTWWSSAAGVYDRGHNPRVGAVVVFQKTHSMRHGHVAVVTDVVNSREVLVDHANWGSRRIGGRGKVAKGMAVQDVSPKNDWSQVRVWLRGSDEFGSRVYPTSGFIYAPGSQPARVQTASLESLTPPVQTASPAPQAPASAPKMSAANASPVHDVTPSAPVSGIQLASATIDSSAHAAKTETTSIAATKAVEIKEELSAASDDDQALARRFGSGHY